MKKTIALLLLVLTYSVGATFAQDDHDRQDHIKRVLLISIDGMHAVDFANCANGISTINRLVFSFRIHDGDFEPRVRESLLATRPDATWRTSNHRRTLCYFAGPGTNTSRGAEISTLCCSVVT